ncbi:hypothetical protein VitviT2T_024094 [Vitis vinifera]|uniref:Myb-like domain-containing protein n=1 Tax=Vitis vinifera TaxID=29760 RepID=A0ABY9DHF3_VITVI|nr:hypothetical protein VitviT2T_024094 [Vitis vinifera]
MIEFRTQTDIKAWVLNEIASVYLLKRIINRRQLSCINFPPKINHYEASSAKHRITITLFLQGKSMMARPEEQRPRWTEEEDHKLIECKSRNPHLSWPNIAMLAGLERSGKSCRERWNNSLTEDNTITRLQRLYGNRFTRTRQPLLQKPSYLEFLRDDEIIDHSVEGDELESLIAEFGSLIPNVNPNETNFGGDYFEPWISGPVSA